MVDQVRLRVQVRKSMLDEAIAHIELLRDANLIGNSRFSFCSPVGEPPVWRVLGNYISLFSVAITKMPNSGYVIKKFI